MHRSLRLSGASVMAAATSASAGLDAAADAALDALNLPPPQASGQPPPHPTLLRCAAMSAHGMTQSAGHLIKCCRVHGTVLVSPCQARTWRNAALDRTR